MIKNKGRYSNIVALAREDAREYRIVNGKNSDVLTQRWYYRLCTWLKIIALVVLAAMCIAFVIGASIDMAETPHTEKGILELKQAILLVSVSLVAISGGFVLTLLKKGDNSRPALNIIGAAVIVIFSAVVAVYLFYAVKSGVNYYDGGLSRFIWRFVVPAAVLAVAAMAQSVMGAVETGVDKDRYDAVLEEAFAKFTEGKNGATYTEQEWEEYVTSYTRKPTSKWVKKTRKKSSKG